MQVIIRCLGRTECVYVPEGQDLSATLEAVQGVFELSAPIDLYSATTKITSSCELSENSNYEAQMNLLGAGKKKSGKKKKNYSTPKKNKHKHANAKLRVLEYYPIGADGKAERVRKLCTNDTCAGKGIILAHHENRYYCGKCHSTYQRQVVAKDKKKVADKGKAKKEEPKKEEAADKKGKKGKK